MGNITSVVVDDDSDTAQIFSELLELLHVKVIGIGHTGIDAIRLVKEKKPDMIFLDIQMPELNGIEALKEIKKNFPAIHVIIITGERFVDPKKISQYGATDLIFKPFEMKRIMQVLEKIKTTDYSVVKSD